MPNSPVICIDASIVVRRLVDVPGEQILDLWRLWTIESYALVAPTLLPYKITNADYRHQRASQLQR